MEVQEGRVKLDQKDGDPRQMLLYHFLLFYLLLLPRRNAFTVGCSGLACIMSYLRLLFSLHLNNYIYPEIFLSSAPIECLDYAPLFPLRLTFPAFLEQSTDQLMTTGWSVTLPFVHAGT